MPERILVVRFGSLGDVILTFGAAELLARTRPKATIVYLVKSEYAELVAAQPWVREARPLTDKDRGFWGGQKLRRRLRAESWAAVLDLQDNGRSRYLTKGLAAIRSRWDAQRSARRAWVWKRGFRWLGLRAEPVRPAWMRFRDAARELGAGEALPPRVHFPEAADRKAQAFLEDWQRESPGPVLALAPAAAWPTKEWSQEQVIALGKRLVGTGWRVLLVSRADERERLGELRAWVQGEPAARWLGADLLTVAAALSKARVAVCPDSGLMHLAAAVGTPVVALFGSTVPELGFAPAGAGHRVIQRDLPCRPCAVHGRKRCPLGHHDCLRTIDPDEIFEIATQVAAQRVG